MIVTGKASYPRPLLFTHAHNVNLVKMPADTRTAAVCRRGGLLRFFALFCSCYVLGVLFLHYSASTAGGKSEVTRRRVHEITVKHQFPQGAGLDAAEEASEGKDSVQRPSRVLVYCKTGLHMTPCGLFHRVSSINTPNSSSS